MAFRNVTRTPFMEKVAGNVIEGRIVSRGQTEYGDFVTVNTTTAGTHVKSGEERSQAPIGTLVKVSPPTAGEAILSLPLGSMVRFTIVEKKKGEKSEYWECKVEVDSDAPKGNIPF